MNCDREERLIERDNVGYGKHRVYVRDNDCIRCITFGGECRVPVSLQIFLNRTVLFQEYCFTAITSHHIRLIAMVSRWQFKNELEKSFLP
jgi:hypothetical protein